MYRTDDENRAIYNEIHSKTDRYTYTGDRNSSHLIPDNCSLLDIGCGRCTFAKNMLDQGKAHTVEACDLSDIAVRFQEDLGVKCVRASITNLPYPNKSFDVITCFEVIEHLEPEDIDKAMSELCRVAKDLIVMTACPAKHEILGYELHRTLKSHDWWTRKFAEYAIVDCGWYDINNVKDGKETGPHHFLFSLQLLLCSPEA